MADTRRFLYQSAAGIRAQEPTRLRTSNSHNLYPPVRGFGVCIPEQSLTDLAGIGPRSGERLARLGLCTVRDLLYYYPRDHIDYARQFSIRDLVAGETVTLVATVRRCNCFSSPRNPKLTIFELVLKDYTGQIKLSRFFAGHRYRGRGWQEQQKRLYPPGAVVAASGLVKESKHGITLENPELEVLQHSGEAIDSTKVGRVVPIYSLTGG